MSDIYRIKRIDDLILYNKESFLKELNSERTKELLKQGSLWCEFFTSFYLYDIEFSNTYEGINRKIIIDALNSIAKIVEINDEDIVVELLIAHPMSEKVKKILENNPDILVAKARVISHMTTSEVLKFITFDIIYKGENKDE